MRSLAMIGALVSIGLVLASILGGEAQETEGYWFESYEPHQRAFAATAVVPTCEARFDAMGRVLESYRGGMLSALEWPPTSEAEVGLGIDLDPGDFSAWYESKDTSYRFELSMGVMAEPRSRSIDEITDEEGRVVFATSSSHCSQYIYDSAGRVVEKRGRDMSRGITSRELAIEAESDPDWWEGRYVYTYDSRGLPETWTFYQRNRYDPTVPVSAREYKFDERGRVLQSRSKGDTTNYEYEGERFCPSAFDTTHFRYDEEDREIWRQEGSSDRPYRWTQSFYQDNPPLPKWTFGKQTRQQAKPGSLSVTSRPTPDGFVVVPAGTRLMGWGSYNDSMDEHEVSITRSFWIGTTEVTQGEWQRLMGDNPSHFSACGTDCPVENVSWYRALEYANARSKEEGLEACYVLKGCAERHRGYSCTSLKFEGLDCEGYRLPTEAEWEYAASGGESPSLFPGGIPDALYCEFGSVIDAASWYCGNASVDYEGCYDLSAERPKPGVSCAGTHPVAQKTANDWGLHDMSGNVAEWVWDWYGLYEEAETDPLGPDVGMCRVIRGGSVFDEAYYTLVSARACYPADRGGSVLGFRLARTVK